MVTLRVVEPLRQTEIDDLADLLVAVVAEGASVSFLPPLARTEAVEYWSEARASGGVLLLAEEAGRIVGTVQLRSAESANGRHRAEVAKLLVHPDYRRRGIGRSLMEGIEAEARRDGRSLLMLDTREGDAANGLYQTLGYREVGRVPRYARAASGRLEATVFYYKELV